jgi:hypothetical protein
MIHNDVCLVIKNKSPFITPVLAKKLPRDPIMPRMVANSLSRVGKPRFSSPFLHQLGPGGPHSQPLSIDVERDGEQQAGHMDSTERQEDGL